MTAFPLKIFISSVQKEMAEERRAVKAFIENDPLLRRFFTVFLFENLPASDRRADAVYLAEVDHSGVAYIKIHGKISNNEYQQAAKTNKKTATRDLNNLREQGILEQRGERGPGVHYVFAKKEDKKGTLET